MQAGHPCAQNSIVIFMPYEVKCYPDSVGKKEIKGLPAEARAEVASVIRDLATYGPEPPAREAKTLKGKHLKGLWQLSLKVNKEQIRLVYFVWGETIIVVVSVFKKTSPQLQVREHSTAAERKKTAERILRNTQDGNDLTAIN
ncbi:MAG: type II toxin-antitoxin system RelE/ParE family toxin [Terricaulis sp.]|nr:type II toxin-antitoxin system RelE/ParE family toxin [Terricaulis sp.]